MNQRLFFQSSLPRSGSTLLQNILGQNPNIYVTPTSGLIDFILGSRIGYNGNKDAQAGDMDLWKKSFYNFCRGGVERYLEGLTSKPYIVDKNRAWGSYYQLMNNILPNPKMIVMVRDLREIFTSMEKKFRNNPEYDDGIYNNETIENFTTHQRVNTWSRSHPIGYTLQKLYQSIFDGTANNFLFIKYELLCENPYDVMQNIYNYLEIPYYNHDFNFIPQITEENDGIHGIYGDHIIRNTLDKKPDEYLDILGEDTCEWIYQTHQWYFNIFGYNK